jgi:hypothetical protein
MDLPQKVHSSVSLMVWAEGKNKQNSAKDVY